ncbi:hypothetical protein ACQVP2_34690 [Methylobacterium aquaticum]|uniref:hypothetical protein n=1 Tax=Methylobacterium aquaticum TaxID=270351 RepID=UPI003D166A49
MIAWRDWVERLLRGRWPWNQPTGMPDPGLYPPEPPDPPLGPDLVDLARSLDWAAPGLKAALRGAPWSEAPPAFAALCARARTSRRIRDACAEHRREPESLLLGALLMIRSGRVPPDGHFWRPVRVFAALGLDWAAYACDAREPEPEPEPLGDLLLALAPRLDWEDPVLRRGLVDSVWTPPPELRALVDRVRDHAGQMEMALYEIGVSLPAHTLVLGCLALLCAQQDREVDALPCTAAGGRVRDFPARVQTAMFMAFDLVWPPPTGAPGCNARQRRATANGREAR